MKLLYFMLLLHFGDNVNGDCKTPGEMAYMNDSFILYNDSGLEITDNPSALSCKWNNSQCYVECARFDLTRNITSINNMSLVHTISVTNQSHKLVFDMSQQEVPCDVTMCIKDAVEDLIIKSSKSSDLKDLKRPVQIKNACTELFASDNAIKKVYIRAEKKYIDNLINLTFNGTTKNYDLEEFSLLAVQMDLMKPNDCGLVQISAPKVPGDDLSLDVFLPHEPFVNVVVGIVVYPSAQIFISNTNTSTALKSNVIRIETAGQDIKHLSKRLVIIFAMNSMTVISENQTLSCQFYDVNATLGQEWSDMGSFTNLETFNSRNTVNCSYDHMTPFAVLLVNMNLTQINSVNWEILSYISYIGCSLSGFFSAVNIFLYIFMKNSYRDISIHIHVSLSAALFLLNTSFLFSEWGATWSQNSACVLIAVLIQYSLLSCFSWMSIEAIHLYLLLIKVFNTHVKHYMVKLSLFGWGLPAVIIVGSLCVYESKPLYGTTHIQLSDNVTSICWITDSFFLYGTNVTFFSFTFLFNLSILVAVTNQIFKLRRLNFRIRKLPSRKDICTVLGLTILLGMTWGFAFFTSGYTNYPVLYLFCICNSLQGFFIFLWFYGTLKRNMAVTSTMSETTSSAVKTSKGSFTK